MPLEPALVADAQDARLAPYRDLRDPAAAVRDGLFVLEGRLLVEHLLASSLSTHSVLVSSDHLARLRSLLAAHPAPPPVLVADTALIRTVVGYSFHRGCLALARRPPLEPLHAFLSRVTDPDAIVVALEGVDNPDNLGGVFRNAMAFGAAGVLLSPGCGDPLYRKAVRVSMGGALAVPFLHAEDWPTALTTLRSAGFTLLALTPGPGARDITDLGGAITRPARTALLVGAEFSGLSAVTRAAADLAVGIRMARGVDSLNLASAKAIALHRLTVR